MNWAEADLIYMAATMDCEGAIVISKRTRCNSYELWIGVSNMREALPLWLKSTFGGRYNKMNASGNRKDYFIWYLHANKAVEILRAIRPYLKLKQEEVDIAIEYQETVKARGAFPYSNLEHELQSILYEQLKLLHVRKGGYD